MHASILIIKELAKLFSVIYSMSHVENVKVK